MITKTSRRRKSVSARRGVRVGGVDWRKLVIRIGITTTDRETYDLCVGALRVNSADELIALARREGVAE